MKDSSQVSGFHHYLWIVAGPLDCYQLDRPSLTLCGRDRSLTPSEIRSGWLEEGQQQELKGLRFGDFLVPSGKGAHATVYSSGIGEDSMGAVGSLLAIGASGLIKNTGLMIAKHGGARRSRWSGRGC